MEALIAQRVYLEGQAMGCPDCRRHPLMPYPQGYCRECWEKKIRRETMVSRINSAIQMNRKSPRAYYKSKEKEMKDEQ